MCAEGIRIGRRTNAESMSGATTNVNAQVFPARPDRIALSLSGNGDVDAFPFIYIIFGGGTANNDRVMCVLNAYDQNAQLTVEEFGQLVTGPVYVRSVNGNARFWATEVYLTEPLAEATRQ